MGKSFNSPYTSSAIMYFMGWIECLIVAACVERDISQWALGWNIRLIAVTYSVSLVTVAIVIELSP